MGSKREYPSSYSENYIKCYNELLDLRGVLAVAEKALEDRLEELKRGDEAYQALSVEIAGLREHLEGAELAVKKEVEKFRADDFAGDDQVAVTEKKRARPVKFSEVVELLTEEEVAKLTPHVLPDAAIRKKHLNVLGAGKADVIWNSFVKVERVYGI